jgi:hypothetical protein
MSKKYKKNKKSKKSYSDYSFKNKTSKYVSPKDIEDIAFKVFGSTYFTPQK